MTPEQTQTPADPTPAFPAIEPKTPPVAATTPPAPAAPQAPATTPVIIGDRVFTSQDDALKYAQDLAVERQRYLAESRAPAPAPIAPTPSKIPLHQLMFEDPEAYHREVTAAIKAEIRQENSQVDTTKQIWESFYRENKDLQGLEDAVELQRQKNWGRIEKLPVDQALKFIAAETRNYVSKIRGTANPGEKVNTGSAQVAGATGSPAPRVEIQANKPSTFMDELKDFRASKRLKTKGA